MLNSPGNVKFISEFFCYISVRQILYSRLVLKIWFVRPIYFEVQNLV